MYPARACAHRLVHSDRALPRRCCVPSTHLTSAYVSICSHQSAYLHVRVCAATDGTWRRLLIRSRRSSPKRTARASRGMAARASSMGPTAGCRGSSGAAATRQSERWDLTTARSHGSLSGCGSRIRARMCECESKCCWLARGEARAAARDTRSPRGLAQHLGAHVCPRRARGGPRVETMHNPQKCVPGLRCPAFLSINDHNVHSE